MLLISRLMNPEKVGDADPGNAYNALQSASNALIDPNWSGDVHKVATGVYALLEKLIPGLTEDSRYHNSTRLESGVALAPGHKVYHRDTLRTRIFVQGLFAAIKSLQKKFKGEKIRVLYAGSNAYAAFATIVSTQFTPNEVEFIALDIHPYSIECVRKIAKALKLEGHFGDYVVADATSYRHTGPAPHVIITETMSLALLGEPQAVITSNLGPQLLDGGEFLPNEVELSCYLGPSLINASNRHENQELGSIFSLTKDSVLNNPHRLDTIVGIPPQTSPRNAYLGTRVRVFGQHLIDRDESQITRSIWLNVTENPSKGQPRSPSPHRNSIFHLSPSNRRLKIAYTLGSEVPEFGINRDIEAIMLDPPCLS